MNLNKTMLSEKTSILRGYVLCDSIYWTTFWMWQNYGNGGQIAGCQRFGGLLQKGTMRHSGVYGNAPWLGWIGVHFLVMMLHYSFFFFLLDSIVLVLPHINMNLPRVDTYSQFWTPLPLPPLHHPSGSSQYTSPRHPAPCIKPRLVIRFLYDIIHVGEDSSESLGR